MCAFTFFMLRYILVLCFCFKQKTAYEMRISDWSSDVCSSDLHCAAIGREVVGAQPILANDDGVGRNRADLLDETREVEGDLGIGRPVVSDGGCDGLRLAESVDLHHPWHDRASRRLHDERGGEPGRQDQRADGHEPPVLSLPA